MNIIKIVLTSLLIPFILGLFVALVICLFWGFDFNQALTNTATKTAVLLSCVISLVVTIVGLNEELEN